MNQRSREGATWVCQTPNYQYVGSVDRHRAGRRLRHQGGSLEAGTAARANDLVRLGFRIFCDPAVITRRAPEHDLAQGFVLPDADGLTAGRTDDSGSRWFRWHL
jgi:hypothetical protein